MPDAAPSSLEVGESRTASVGRRGTAAALPTSTSTSTSSLHSATSSPRSTSSKKRRRGKQKFSDVRDFVPMGANFSKSSELLQTSPSNHTNPAHPSSPISQPSQDDGLEPTDMAPSNTSLGNNRLATGFKPPRSSKSGVSTKSLRNYSFSSSAPDTGGSMDDAIEISSDEDMEDSEGGMVVNLNDDTPALTENSVTEDEGLVTSDDEADLQIQQDLTSSAGPVTVDDANSSNLRLLDLNPGELEEQLKYALYHLDRTQVDLNRLATCLSCMQLGHISSGCPQSTCKHCEEDNDHPTNLCPFSQRCTKCRARGHTVDECISDMKNTTVPCDICGKLSHVNQACPQRHFLQPSLATPIKLWISCCICASKSHLVGDCPDAPRNSATASWSLKSLDPGQVTNLSLESGTRRLEKDAETRGMRPSGMQIKGRASLHHAGVSKSAPDSDDEQEEFLRPSVGRNYLPPKPQVRMGTHEIRRPDQPRATSDRYDRFDAPSFDARDQDRARGDWYATDSFGRRRSRSPRADSWRPSLRRSPSPRRFDGYPQSDRGYRGPPPSDYWRPSQNGLPARPTTANHHPTAASSNPPRPVKLPSRKGSNLNLPSKPPTAVQSKSNTQQSQETNNPSKAQGSNNGGRKKNKKKRAGGGPSDSELFAPSDSNNDFSVLGSVTTKDLTFSSDGAICLDLPDNIQVWLDKINSKRRSKGQKPMFVSEVEDTPHPSQIKLYDVETGAIQLEKGIACSNIAAKGFRLLGIPQALHGRPDQQIAQKPTHELGKRQPAEEAAQPSTQELNDSVHHDFGRQTMTRGGGMTLRNGKVTDAEQSYNRESGQQILSEGDGMKLRSGTVTGMTTMMILARGRGGSDVGSCTTGANHVQILRDNLPDTAPMVEAGAPSEFFNRPESTLGRQIWFGDLSVWLELENNLRKAQGKGAVQLRRASAGETDHHGQPILQYLTDPVTGTYRAFGQRRLNEIRKIGKLLRLQKEQRALDKQERKHLEEELRVMRGQALPQPAPAEFAAAIHAGYKKAASEGRQLVLSQLSLDVTAPDIEQFFGDLGVESICIGYDSITDIPTGVAHVDMETSRGANEAVQSLAEKKLLGKEVHLKLNVDRNASGITRLVRELSILPDRAGHEFGSSPKPVINEEPAGGSTAYLDDKPKRPLSILREASLSPSIITNPIEVGDEGKEHVKQARHTENGEAKSNDEERSASSTVDDSRAALSRQPLARLVRLDSYLEMANQERATYGLVPLTRTPGDSVYVKETYIHDPALGTKTKTSTATRRMVNRWYKSKDGNFTFERKFARIDARQVWIRLGCPPIPKTAGVLGAEVDVDTTEPEGEASDCVPISKTAGDIETENRLDMNNREWNLCIRTTLHRASLVRLEGYLKMVNEQRAAFGLNPLNHNEALMPNERYLIDPHQDRVIEVDFEYQTKIDMWALRTGPREREIEDQLKSEAREEARAVWVRLWCPPIPGIEGDTEPEDEKGDVEMAG